jgi:DNA topoisomerase-3
LIEGQALDGTFAAQAKKTQPPRRYSEATLLSAMESAGRALDDEELRAAMKDTGLGTPATRAAIIETLLKRGYARRERTLIVATATGRALVESLPVASLASPELTGAWEARLARIARGQESRGRFMEDIAAYVRELVAAVAAVAPSPAAQAAAAGATVGRCPRCGGAVRAGRRAFACAAACGFSMPARVAGRAIGDKLAAVLLARRRSEVLRGFRGKSGKRFAAGLLLDDDGSLRFAFDGEPARKTKKPQKPAKTQARAKTQTAAKPKTATKPKTPQTQPAKEPLAALGCPRCGAGTLIAGKRGWGCARWREGCRFVVWFETAGRRLSESQLRDLVVRGKTRRARFRPDGGAEAEGRLVLDLAGDGGARFTPA